ncbi:MAG: hypothetical protein HUJ68_00840 [Clostridia bacterium]|nr:hypothetical protein [Clostridia bacterium]
MIYEEKFRIGLNDIGKEDKLTNHAILEILENVGSYHSDCVGYGLNEMKSKNIGWVLLEWKAEIIERPSYGPYLTVKTWCSEINKFFCYRDYEIYDHNNKLCVSAIARWTILDLEERKMIRIGDVIKDAYQAEEKNVSFKTKWDKLKIPTEFMSEYEYTVQRRDLDVNGHMHNLYYLDLAYETLPQEIYEQRPFDQMRITYKKEILLGQKLKCKYTKEEGKHIIVIEGEDKTIHAIVEL